MSAAAARKLPAEEEDLSPEDDLSTREVIGGEVMMSPRPGRRHIRTETLLARELGYHFDGPVGGRRGPGGWMIVQEPELHLGRAPDEVSPDLCGWRLDRAPEINDESAFTTVPDWICEVLSPSPRARRWDRKKKMPMYARHRVGHLWLVDPVARELEVHALGRRGWELIGIHSGHDIVRPEPFEQMELHLSALWAQESGDPLLTRPRRKSRS